MPLSILLWLPLAFAAVCGWQAWSGWRQIRLARAHPDHPNAPIYERVGKMKLWIGGAAIAINLLGILLNRSLFL